MHKMVRTCLEHCFFQAPILDVQQLNQHFAGKVVLITGASFGIGEAMGAILSKTACRLIVLARNEEKLAQLTQEWEAAACQVDYFSVDLYEASSHEKIMEFLQSLNVEIDILIHNAGKSIRRSVWESVNRPQDIERTIHINYTNPAHLTQSLLPQLQRKQGQVMCVSTINAKLFSPPLWSHYQASKSAMQQWLLSIQPELQAKKILVSLVYLPLVRTRMIAPTKAYQDVPVMGAEDAARAVLSCCVKHKKQWQPWWLGMAQMACVILARPIAFAYARYFQSQKAKS